MEKFISVTRVYNAPVESVWKTWVEPELIKRWWGPDRFSCPSAEIDFREGGKSVVCMQSRELGFGETYSLWEYKKIIPFERIEFVQNLADKSGNRMHPRRLGNASRFSGGRADGRYIQNDRKQIGNDGIGIRRFWLDESFCTIRFGAKCWQNGFDI